MRTIGTFGWAAVIYAVQDWMAVLALSMLLFAYVVGQSLEIRTPRPPARKKPKRRLR